MSESSLAAESPITHIVKALGEEPLFKAGDKLRISAAIALALLALSAAFFAFGQPIPEGKLPQPKLVIIDKSLNADQAQKAVHAARLFYAFWNTGDPQFARLALALISPTAPCRKAVRKELMDRFSRRATSATRCLIFGATLNN
jgi:hypothetical protein